MARSVQIFYAALIIFCLSGISFSQDKFWTKYGGPGGEPASSVAIDSSGNIYVGEMAFIARSTDEGQTWTSITSGILPMIF